MELIHLVIKLGRSDWASRFKDAQLLLIEDLRVRKILISSLTEMRSSHHLLRHHQVVGLWPVDSFLTLDRPNSTNGTSLNASAANGSN